ncbi:tRNA lysidine(34) synthetase TilS [Robertkochia marina]|uniref:tRNA(Ile)-lysidine synthase n=1 Tax=Robertkochia marina TaxID=1227945 RepID=A0A4S3M257_9FLAO|nr:tRNA lysidine(34) synthetase TilS [Robertkochia marina]THD67669.1 tRNA lysidine(34) synthetase TilS [Robertkochia marina]TRZ43400.1 tRNA lysidine(34) synthetase TilS [Robertkochia marina]
MKERFKSHIETYFPFLENNRLIIALSGGLDSVVLAFLCRHCCGFDTALAHCNFQLRGEESNRDETFVRELGAKWNLPVYVKRFDTELFAEQEGISTQMAARDLRYEWFYELMEQEDYRYLLTGHHADDNLETFIINLSRGTGLEGLTGIPPVNGNVVRPLLPFSREEIENFAREENLSWIEDSSNSETKYLRNKIRHEVIPSLKDINPTLMNNFNKTIDYIQGSAAMLDDHIRAVRSALFTKEKGMIRVPVASLKNLRPTNAYLYAFFHKYGFTEWNDVEGLLSGQTGKMVLSASHRLFRDRDFLVLQHLNDLVKEEEVTYVIREKNTRFTGPVTLSFESVDEITHTAKDVIYVDEGKLSYPLKIRKWEEGDRFEPFGLKGSKKISKYFKDEKYSLAEKERQWLLCDAQDRIVWVIGRRADNRFRVDETTSEILKIRTH